MIYSVLDLGSNSFHWLTMQVDTSGKFSTLFRTRKIFRLREGKEDIAYTITPEAMSGALSVIKEIMDECSYITGNNMRIIATSATREAINRDEFTGKITELTGHPVEIITGESEAKYISSGIRTLYPAIEGTNDILFDIGGGSTEIIFDNGNPAQQSNFSLPLGSVRMMKKFFRNYKLTSHGLAEMREFIPAALSDAGITEKFSVQRAIGSSGSINILNKLCEEYNASPFPGYVPATFIRKIGEDILAIHDSDERERIFGLESPKAQIIPAGLIIILYLLDVYSLTGIYYSTANLKEGVILEMHKACLANGTA